MFKTVAATTPKINSKLSEDAINKLRICDDGDPEEAHFDADKILCEVLTELGYVDVINRYNQIEKWYA